MFELGDSTETPGAVASGLLSRLPESDWTGALREHHAAVARAQFTETDAVTTLYLARCAEDARLGRNDAVQGEFVGAEVGHILRLTERSAQRLIELGLDLRWRLHRTSIVFSAGGIDQARAFAISDALANVSPNKVDLIEQLLLDDAEHLNTTTLRAKARRLIARHDPDGAAERRRRAEDDRDVRIRANDDGTCAVEGTLPGPAGQVVAMRLRAMCFDACGHDPRTFAQRRADALVALAEGGTRLECLCGRSDCTKQSPAEPETAPPTDHEASSGISNPAALPPLPPATVHVSVNVTTLLGLDDLPGFLAGHGAIDADLAREIASDATWRKMLTLNDTDRTAIVDALADQIVEPDTAGDTARASTRHLPHGPILGIGRALKSAGVTPTAIRARTKNHREHLTYRPSTRLADVVRARDGHCRFPGCVVRARSCDLDHTVPFDHDDPVAGGRTTEQNLACLCRRHHRLKTEGLWTVRQLGGGRLEWTTPARDTVTTTPGGAASADEEIAAALGLTLTDSATLERHFGPHRGRDAASDLYFLIELHQPVPSRAFDLRRVVIPQQDVLITVPATVRTRTPEADPAPF
ncbi:HNH endonuclease signature motif containing protein [Rhodococcus gannanensis]|uniref:DUF222 domain-containing protein n=1 Tax=Rhodococcus gannanensis TaxID=1960308 RepID=A0ABW4P6P1_9NOCA